MCSLMYKEIFSEPVTIKNTIDTNKEIVKEVANAIKSKNIKTIFTMARGSSDNAATCFSYACQTYTDIKVGSIHPSIFTIYNSNTDMSNTCVLVISQSGMSSDTIDVMRKAKKYGALIVGVTNNLNSTVAKEADYHLFMNVEEEKSVAATKTYIGEVTALYMLVNALTNNKLSNVIDGIPSAIEKALEKNSDAAKLAKKISSLDNFIILSRGQMLGTGNELGLKLTECCYLFTKSMSLANFMHGPLSLLSDKVNVIILSPTDEFINEAIQMAKTAKLNGANLITLTDNDELKSIANLSICMPKSDNLTNSITYGVLASLIALNVGTEKNINVDAPRNLNKVTVTL